MRPELADIFKLQCAVGSLRDESAYRELFVLFYTPAIRFATGIVNSEEVAEELYSDAMMKIWLMGPSLEKVSGYKVYLFTLIKNSAFNHLKKHKYNHLDFETHATDISTAVTPEHHLIEKELRQSLEQAVSRLPPQCRNVYVLIKEEGFSYKQTAEILNISTNTVEGHMTNALRKITVMMKAYLY